MRVAKVLRFGGYRINVGFDFYNLFNANTGTAFNQVYDVVSNGAELAAADLRAQSTVRTVQFHAELLIRRSSRRAKNHDGDIVDLGIFDLAIRC